MKHVKLSAGRKHRLNPSLSAPLLVVASLLSLGTYQLLTAQQVSAYIPIVAVTRSSDHPSEAAIPSDTKYIVPANMPRRIIITSIGVNNFVQPVGVDQHGAMAVPQNVNLGGWFNQRASPGEIGVSIIDGHVSGKKYPGIFYRLAELKAGDTYKIEMGDYTVRNFIVMKAVSYTTQEANTELYRQYDDRQVTLVTCTGKFDKQSQEYPKRQIVYSKRM